MSVPSITDSSSTGREPNPAAPTRTERAGGENPGHGRRPALDGIRALAVVAVMVYHFGGGAESWLPGGFLGVDIFFVLSGYLITGLLLSEYARTGRIGLGAFWVRRARRLVPALVVVLLAVIAWIWWLAPPESYPARRTDLFWTAGYLANWHLIGSGDNYFAAYSAASPLRHTWSLAVEEQFYLVWPLLAAVLLWLGHRLARARVLAGRRPVRFLPLAALAAGGGLLSVWIMASSYDPLSPSAAYYSTFGRVQELFAGVLLALAVPAVRRAPGRIARRVLAGLAAGAGVLLVLALATMPDTWAGYYRGGALGVSLVTAMLIGGMELRPDGALARAFAWRPAVALGRISYGVYLWHWPITVALPVAAVWPLSEKIEQQVQRVLLTLVLAGLSFWLVERPIQHDRRWLRHRVAALGAVAASMVVVIGAGVAATALPGTMSQQLGVTSDRSCLGERVDHLISCLAPAGADPATARPAFALLGDSIGRGLGTGFDAWALRTGNTWVEAGWKRCTATGLLVVRSNELGPEEPYQVCARQAPDEIRTALATYRPKTVIISEFGPSSQPIWIGDRHLDPGTPEHAAALGDAYRRLVDEIAGYGGRAVFVTLPPPGQSIGLDVAAGRPAATTRGSVLGDGKYVDSYNAVLASVVADRPGQAGLVSLDDVICPGGVCPGSQDGTIIRVDGLHYSKAFAQTLAPILLERAGVTPGP